MTAIAVPIVPAVHTGECRSARPAASDHQARGYCVHDSKGRPVGVIAAAAKRPVLGPNAPTFYLRRD